MAPAGVGEARRAGDLPADRAGEGAAGVDVVTRGDSGDRGEQEQGEESRQADVLDARRPALARCPPAGCPSLLHATTLGGRDARVARGSSGLVGGSAYIPRMEGSPFNLFGDPDEFRARMEELSEQMQSSQRVAWADNAIKLAVEMTVASIGRLELTGNADEQAMQVRDAIRVLFPEAVTLVREAREGLS